MTTINKRNFNEALKNNDQSEVWHQVALHLGKKPTRHEVYDCIERFASTKYASAAHRFAYSAFRKDKIITKTETIQLSKGLFQRTAAKGREVALKMARRLFEEPITSYSKIPMLGHKELLFCSPWHGLKDYNKVYACEIEGNEDFVNKIIGICKKFADAK